MGAIPEDPNFRRLVYERTFGLHRTRIVLLKIAYLRARKRGASSITNADVEASYNSAEFYVFRTDVEDLHRLALGSGTRLKRDDLICPFGADLGLPPCAADVAKDARQEKIERQAVRSSLTPKEEADLVKSEKTKGLAIEKPKAKHPAPPELSL